MHTASSVNTKLICKLHRNVEKWQMVRCGPVGIWACSLGLGCTVRDKVRVSVRDRIAVTVCDGVRVSTLYFLSH